MKLIIFGPQGSGKSTQAKIISSHFNLPHISTGNIFREEISRGSNLGNNIEEAINSGSLVDDNIVNDLIKNKIAEKDCANGYVLDGYPRNLAQAQFLEYLSPSDFALEVVITDEEAIGRLSAQRTCPQCRSTYHMEINKPDKEGFCNKCGTKLITREDDKKEIVEERLKIYHIRTALITDFYLSRNIYHKIDGSKTVNEVTQEIISIIK